MIIIIPLLILVVTILINVFIIRTICDYLAKQNAKAFDYDRLENRTAEEICKRMMIIERQKACNAATNSAENGTTADNEQ